VTLRYQWLRSGLAIAGATASAYTETAADLGKTLSVRVTGSKVGYSTAVRISRPTPLIVPGTLTAPVPTVSGVAKVGSRLTGIPGAWGPAPVTLKYQWLRSGLAIAGATASTYTETAADLGKTVSLRITGSKTGYTAVARTSRTTPVIVAGTLSAPSPTISGVPKVASVLSAAPGVWGPAPVILKYQWLKTGVAIAGATAATYSPIPSDVAKQISVRVSGSRAGYATMTRTSAGVTVGMGVLAAPTPNITGTARVDSALTAVPGTWTASTSLTYQWLRNGEAISGATQSTFVPAPSDQGAQISVRVTGSKTGYTTISKTSTATPPIAAAALNAPIPTISGRPEVGATLIAEAGVWGPGNVALKYSWAADGLPIAGADQPAYTPEMKDAGKAITVTVTGTKPGYVTADKTSAATDPVSTVQPTHLSGTIAEDTTWSPHQVYVLDSSLTVPAGVTLTIEAGTVIKYQRLASLNVAGSLVVAGTAAAPVVFTSLKDDSAGGDTNGDGTATKAAARDWDGLVASGSGATLRLDGAEVRFSGVGVSGSNSRSLSVSNSVVRDGGGIRLWAEGPVSVTGSQVLGGSGIYVHQYAIPENAAGSTTTVSGNTVDRSSDAGIVVTSDRSPGDIPAPVVQDNRITGSAGRALAVGFVQVDPGKITGNTGTGNKINDFAVSGILAGNLTLPVAGLPVTVGRTFGQLPSTGQYGLEVPDGVTLTVNAGTVVKVDGTGSSLTNTQIHVAGSLVVAGTAAAPVVFTSLKDDSAGGDTNGDGTATKAAARDWDGISSVRTSKINGAHFEVRYGATLLTLGGTAELDSAILHWGETCISASGTVTVSGKVTDCPGGVYSVQNMDARNVDWGSPDGPPPFGPGTKVSGNVQVAPWVGFTPPPPAEQPPAGGWSAGTAKCASTLVIGVRGSGEPPRGPTAVQTDPSLYDAFTYAQTIAAPGQEFRGLGPKIQSILTGQTVTAPGQVVDRATGFLDGLKPEDSASVKIMPLIYPGADTALLAPGAMFTVDSNPVGAIPWPDVTPGSTGFWLHVSASKFAEYMSSIRSGVLELEGQLIHAATACPNQKIVLVGYSQGAMVIQMALADLVASPGVASSVITSGFIRGVLLLANPLQDPFNSIGTYLGSGSSRGLITALNKAPGVTSLGKLLLGFDMTDSYPSAVSAKTVSYCTAGDVMCAPLLQFSVATHVGYTSEQLAPLGAAGVSRFYN
jgi:hypothetical protein